MIAFIDYLSLPHKVGLAIIAAILFMQVVGEILEFKGKIVPEWMKIRKFFSRRKAEKANTAKTLTDVRQLLDDVKGHYSVDNIAKRDAWMQWVNSRAITYDNSIDELRKSLLAMTIALQNNTKMTEEMFVQSSRDRIIDFATKVSCIDVPVSREEFNRIFKVHTRYEQFLEEHNMTNGEIDVAYKLIVESYEKHMKNHSFVEDVRGFTKN